MANNPTKWSTPDPVHLVLDISSNLADAANQISATTDASGLIFSAWELGISGYHTAPTANSSVDLFLVPVSQDGGGVDTDGDATIDPPSSDYVGSFPVRAVLNNQRIPMLGVVTPPYNFTPLIQNNTGQTIPAGSGSLRVRFYTQDLVT